MYICFKLYSVKKLEDTKYYIWECLTERLDLVEDFSEELMNE